MRRCHSSLCGSGCTPAEPSSRMPPLVEFRHSRRPAGTLALLTSSVVSETHRRYAGTVRPSLKTPSGWRRTGRGRERGARGAVDDASFARLVPPHAAAVLRVATALVGPAD